VPSDPGDIFLYLTLITLVPKSDHRRLFLSRLSILDQLRLCGELYCYDTTYSSGEVTRDGLEEIWKTSKSAGTRDTSRFSSFSSENFLGLRNWDSHYTRRETRQ